MTVKAGYKIERDAQGLTGNERTVLKGLLAGKKLSAIGAESGVSRARASKIAKDLVGKGWLIPGTKQGQYAIETKKVAVIQSW